MAAALPLVPQPIGDLQQPGNYLVVKYDIAGDPTWHARLLLAHLHEGEWIILTPDGDIYSEDYSPDNVDISSWRSFNPGVGYPYGVPPHHVHDFNPRPDQQTVQRLLGEGGIHASHERIRRNLPIQAGPPAVAADQVAAAAAPAVGGGGAALAPLAGGGHGVVGPVGPNAQVPAADVVMAGIGGGPLAHLGAGGNAAAADAASDDARTLGITRNNDGVRFKEFRQAAQESKAVEFNDWPIQGPRTVKHVITQMINHGGSAQGHHQSWRTACRFQPTDGPSMEHESWCRVLDAMVSYDQLDATNLASGELVVRAIQRIEERHKHKLTTNDDSGESALFMGAAGGSRSGLVISPKLTEWIGGELQKDALVAKERRKAREERALSRKNEKKEDPGK